MKDELEKYIEGNISEFDDFNLDEVDRIKLWGKIDAALSEPIVKVVPLWKRTTFRIAASIVILMACTMAFFKMNDYNSENQMVNQELHQINAHYKALVDNQIQMIKTNSNLNDQEKKSFLKLADDLDIEYGELKNELKEGINNQKIIEAIINNYKRKIELMESLLERSGSSKNNFDSSEIIL